MTTPVNLSKLNSVFDAQVLQGIKYRLGGKAPSLSASPPQLEKGIDCSGEVRLLVYQATDGEVVMPDGSWNQRAWCEKNLEEVPYSQAMQAKKGELYVAFITAGVKGAGKVGHVWLMVERDGSAIAETMESYGGHGIGSRSANTGVLTRLVHKCFKIPTVVATVAPAKPVLAVVPPEPLAVIDGKPFALVMVGDRPFVSARDLLEAGGQSIEGWNNQLQEKGRFYINTEPKK